MASLLTWLANQTGRDDEVGEYARARARGEAGDLGPLFAACKEFKAVFSLKGEPMSDRMKGEDMIDFPEPPAKPRDGSMEQPSWHTLGPRTIEEWLG